MVAPCLTGRFRFYNRLQSQEDFAAVFACNNRSSDELFLFLSKKNGTDIARLGLAISKKYIKKSVDRNRIKRIVRESFRLQKKNLKGIDVVVLLKKEINKRRIKEIKILDTHWEKTTK
ncbi:MAG: ribonuclease P protein component [Legionellales bacterium]|nr:ribonuclease P protein component [Legionellales bacterium]|tara:strand:- start:760 stop:1113 length:354 start_codon:yes stop_codon:yes gene_type:complete